VEEIEVEVEEEEEGEGKKNIPARADKSTAADDDDLGDYSDRVRRRINKLTKDKHDERRAREEAENLRDEAVRVATVLQQRNQQSEHIIATGEGELVRRIHQGAEAALNAAETEHRVAYESGDTDAVIASQKKMLKAQAELLQATQYAEDYQRRQWQPGEPFAGQMPPQMPPQI
jgi:dsDNA-specific endonuclease/ATPase MutS2